MASRRSGIGHKGRFMSVALSSDKAKSRWLYSLGKGLAEILGLAKNGQKEHWRMTDFPADYRLYTYIKGAREDQYLFGSTHVKKFRAKNQFEVNAALGLPHSASKTKPEGSQSADRSKRPKRLRSPPSNNQVNSNYKYQGPYLNEELNRDLLENRSNFRKHELVWCLVTDLIVGVSPELSRNSQELGIKYWPGLCEEPTLFNESRAIISIPDDGEDRNEDVQSKKRKVGQVQTSTPKSTPSEFQNEQRFKWNIRLLGLSDIVTREEGQLLPWLFKTADLKQKFGMNKKEGLRLPQHVQNRHQTMRPTLESFATVDETLVAFRLAIQIAANLEEFWVAHDRYDAAPDLEIEVKPSEKIWLYDFVRLNEVKLGPHLSSKRRTSHQSPVNSSTTSRPREDCYFLKIEGIYRDELGKKLIVMGKLFELIPLETGPTLPTSSSPPLNTEKQRCNRAKKWIPDPPAGYKFKQLTKSKEMNYLHVECISGRYYSPTRKNSSNQLSEICKRLAPKLAQECDQVAHPHQALVTQNSSLFGLTPGHQNFMRCRKWKPGRAECIFDAESQAEEELISAFEKLKSTRSNRASINQTDENHFTKHKTRVPNNEDQHKNHGNGQANQQTRVI
ncbi:hypothetical protein KEM48_014472 [Puccinia striiformis f. sp. tritici PST-130]|nr:hypothetical protein KEM48_014472 [Puccinia striiformis f. sp. tritici PST-130]